MLFLLTFLLSTPHAFAAGLPTEDLAALVRTLGGRYILSELGLGADTLQAANLSVARLRPLTEGMEEIRARYLGEHPEDSDLFGEKDPSGLSADEITGLQRTRLRDLVHREGLESIEFVRATDDVRGFAATRATFLHGGTIPTGMTTVTDQLDTLQCWAVTATARADLDAGFKLSARYTVYSKTKAEVIDLITGQAKIKSYRGQLVENGPFENIYYEQGGVFADAVEAVRVFGAMPEEAYPGFPKKDDALFEDLNAVFKDFAARIKTGKIERGSSAVRAEVDQKVTAILNRHWGKPPERFAFRGKTFDALDIRDQFLPSWRNPQAIELNYFPGSHNGPSVTSAFDGENFRSYKTGNHSNVMNALEASLRAGFRPVLQYKVVEESRTQRDGEIGFGVHGQTKPAQVDWNSKDILDHYVLAIAGEWDAEGHLQRLLIKNTWDTSPSANFGFHWIEADYFSLFEAVEVPSSLEPQFRAKGWLK
jgi:hypothetical protein